MMIQVTMNEPREPRSERDLEAMNQHMLREVAKDKWRTPAREVSSASSDFNPPLPRTRLHPRYSPIQPTGDHSMEYLGSDDDEETTTLAGNEDEQERDRKKRRTIKLTKNREREQKIDQLEKDYHDSRTHQSWLEHKVTKALEELRYCSCKACVSSTER